MDVQYLSLHSPKGGLIKEKEKTDILEGFTLQSNEARKRREKQNGVKQLRTSKCMDVLSSTRGSFMLTRFITPTEDKESQIIIESHEEN